MPKKSKKQVNKASEKSDKTEEFIENTGNALRVLVDVILWITGILVALAVGFGMIDKTLVIPGVLSKLTPFAGWVIVVMTILGVVIALFDALRK